MRRFIVPVDGSENALRAVHYAVSLARDESPAHIFLVTVQLDPVLYGEAALYVDFPKLERAQREAAERVLAQAEAVFQSAGVEYQKEILRGEVAPTIAERAEALKCDVIVMGTRGLGAFASLVMGSTAMKVLHLTKLPVTLIK